MASGRKREFDTDGALDAAMHTFWQKGYVGTSMSDLIDSMGINKPSMYRAFGNKESLFIKATQRYIEQQMKPHLALLTQAGVPLKQRLKNHIMSIISMQANPEHPFGCYLVLCQSELASGSIPDDAKHMLTTTELMPKQQYSEFFTTDADAIAQGLNKNAEVNALTLYTFLKGTASMARSGVTLQELASSVDIVLNGIGLQ